MTRWSLPSFSGLIVYPFLDGLSDLWFGGAQPLRMALTKFVWPNRLLSPLWLETQAKIIFIALQWLWFTLGPVLGKLIQLVYFAFLQLSTSILNAKREHQRLSLCALLTDSVGQFLDASLETNNNIGASSSRWSTSPCGFWNSICRKHKDLSVGMNVTICALGVDVLRYRVVDIPTLYKCRHPSLLSNKYLWMVARI